MTHNSPVSKSSGKTGNGNGKNGHNMLYSLPTLYRGIYNRVAEKVGCDPSYVSRVARGERTSEAVARALENEIRHTITLSTRHLNSRSSRNGAARNRARA
jgi:hypothetical protein